ncbi:MAG: NAD(P)-dependent oxidoreductase [Flavobacteriaceae bacterium]|nr:NAD(P)-dependent oxidoreductase [Flavobacteriaceae bacterium]
MKTIFITGATSGIGLAIAKKMANSQNQLILCGRRQKKLDEISKKLSAITNVLTLCFDISEKKEVTKLLENLPKEYNSIDILINNAGNAHGLDKIQDGSLDDWDNMVDSNIKGLLYVSRVIIPKMIKKGSGHIINIGSLAGREVYEKGNIYCATKHAVNAISKAMRIDLNKTGIKVSEVNPGLVETDFSSVRFKGDSDRAEKVYQGYKALQADDIADIIEFVINRPNHVNIADILVLPQAQATSSIIKKN